MDATETDVVWIRSLQQMFRDANEKQFPEEWVTGVYDQHTSDRVRDYQEVSSVRTEPGEVDERPGPCCRAGSATSTSSERRRRLPSARPSPTRASAAGTSSSVTQRSMWILTSPDTHRSASGSKWAGPCFTMSTPIERPVARPAAQPTVSTLSRARTDPPTQRYVPPGARARR